MVLFVVIATRGTDSSRLYENDYSLPGLVVDLIWRAHYGQCFHAPDAKARSISVLISGTKVIHERRRSCGSAVRIKTPFSCKELIQRRELVWLIPVMNATADIDIGVFSSAAIYRCSSVS